MGILQRTSLKIKNCPTSEYLGEKTEVNFKRITDEIF